MTTIEYCTFNGCYAMESVSLPESLTAVGEMAFQDCRSLTDVSIPDNVATIADYAFFSCPSLKTLTLGSSLKSIGNLSFYSSQELEAITVRAIEPPVATVSTFNPANYTNAGLRVPYESIGKYKTAPVWENFFTDRWPLTGIEAIEATQSDAAVVERFDLTGRPVADDFRGLSVVRRADGSVAKELRR